jgi:hypothetical protein
VLLLEDDRDMKRLDWNMLGAQLNVSVDRPAIAATRTEMRRHFNFIPQVFILNVIVFSPAYNRHFG